MPQPNNHKSTGARRQYPANGTTHSWKVRHSPEAAAFSRSLKGRVRTATNTDPQSSRIQPQETLETLLRLIYFPLWVFACYLWNHLSKMPESMDNGWLRELLIIPNWCIASLDDWWLSNASGGPLNNWHQSEDLCLKLCHCQRPRGHCEFNTVKGEKRSHSPTFFSPPSCSSGPFEATKTSRAETHAHLSPISTHHLPKSQHHMWICLLARSTF